MQYGFRKLEESQIENRIPDFANVLKFADLIPRSQKEDVCYFCGMTDTDELMAVSVWSLIPNEKETIALRYMTVFPEYRGKYYGRELLSEAMAAFAERGYTQFYTRTLGNLDDLIRQMPFLISAGFLMLAPHAFLFDGAVHMQEYVLLPRRVSEFQSKGKAFLENTYTKAYLSYLKQKGKEYDDLYATSEDKTKAILRNDFWTMSKSVQDILKVVFLGKEPPAKLREEYTHKLYIVRDAVQRQAEVYGLRQANQIVSVWKTDHLLGASKEQFALSDISVIMCPVAEPGMQDLFTEDECAVAERDTYICMGAFLNSELMGAAFISYDGEGNCFAIRGIRVLEKYRAKGIGSEILKACVKQFAPDDESKLVIYRREGPAGDAFPASFFGKFPTVLVVDTM